MTELWVRPWAGVDRSATASMALWDGASVETDGPVWLCLAGADRLLVEGRPGAGREVFQLAGGHQVWALPVPLHPSRGLRIGLSGGGTARLCFPSIPDRPVEVSGSAEDGTAPGARLLARVKAVWARLQDVQLALADPSTLWETLYDRWMVQDDRSRPAMDAIVQQGRLMPPVLERLGHAPRRVLRRTQQMVRLSRVQELDRRALTWLVRQPGETLIERAGPQQRIRAVAREENLDTPENRVLRSYADLAHAVARDFGRRHPVAHSEEGRAVAALGRQCRQLTLDLAQLGVGEARPEMPPNFVLQSNPEYRTVWDAWRALLHRERVLDELWRWQARSWEEFCALAVVVALRSMPGARVVASSPLQVRRDQEQGRWLEYVNPLAVLHLPLQDAIVEVQYGRNDALRLFGATIWLRFGALGRNDILTRWAIWPVWHPAGGPDPSDLPAIRSILPDGRAERLRGGTTIRPAADEAASLGEGNASSIVLSADGIGLKHGLGHLRAVLADILAQHLR